MILNLPGLSQGWRRSLLGAALASCLCLYALSVAPSFSGYLTRWNDGKETYRRMEEILDTVPGDASVNCSTFLLAHIADRSEIYEVAYHGNRPDVDYVVLDIRYGGWQQVRKIYLAQGYEEVTFEPGLIAVLKKGGT